MECVGIAGNFEEAMSNVEALSGASAEEMSALTAEAKELGATTKFTAQESADAMGYMAMAGWGTSEMLAGMSGVMDLAAASGEDLAMVSDIVTDNLTAFGLAASDTAHFSDVLAAAATNSNTSVSIMGETFKQSASIAGALGYSVEDVAVAVGLMANSGVKGSIAGTALKNTFNGLLEGATLTAAAFGDYEFSALKADGTMKSFGDTINELRGYFEQMTEAERVNNAMAIAGQRGYNGLLAILNATDEDYTSLTNSINDCTGAARRMAAVKLDNMNGELTIMNSAWEGLKITLGEQFTPVMGNVYTLLTDVFNSMDDFVQRHPALIKAVMAFVGVLGAVVAGMAAFAAITKVVIPLMGLLTASIPGVNIIAGIAVAVGAVTAAVVGFVSAANEGVPSVKELTEAAQDMQEAMDEAGAAYQDTATQTIATAEVAETYIGKLEELEASLGDAVSENEEYHNILALLTRTVPELSGYIDLQNNTIEGGTAALREHTEAWKKDAETQAYQDYLNSLYDQYGAVMQESAENSIKLTQAQIKLETAEKNRDAALERMNELSQEAYENGGYLTQEYYDLQNAVYGYNDEIYKTEKTIKNLNKAIDEDAEAVAAAEAEIEGATEAVEQLTGATAEMTEAEMETARQTEALNTVIGSTAERAAALVEAYNEAYTAAYDSVSGQYAIWEQAADVVATSAGTINEALESQTSYWEDYNSNLASLRDRAGDIEGLSDVIASFADGSADSVNAIAGLANASDEDLTAMVENWQALQKAQDETSQNIADLKTDFTEQMDALGKELEADIEAMDFGTEASEAAKATIQGYIDGANGQKEAVRRAYASIGAVATAALNGGSTSSGTPGNAYAGGTENAAPGWALVGEHGPEAVFFRGGETVLTASRTGAFLDRNSSGGAPPIQIGIQVSGNATTETAQALRDAAAEVALAVEERIMDRLENDRTDERRRAYA